ncbi:putative 28S ribosomal protein S16, mitochondrial [Toxocara canis]|uniref:Small ribosomal subunit protein bS16m n=1 Tax=Toxocara canis TaxID=6265 RepID=A0A0B2V3M0_TOXCA|nr:putative 28S ribosomal protein S16, mitochondrial [Toxocara canis]
MRKLVLPKYFGRPSIGLALFGCTNRPFYHICVFPDRALGRRCESNIIEQVGTFDPLPNVRNEKLVALNIGRIKYWVAERNAHISVPVLELLGLSGLFPIHPKTFIRARDSRRLAELAAHQAAVKREADEKAKEEKREQVTEAEEEEKKAAGEQEVEVEKRRKQAEEAEKQGENKDRRIEEARKEAKKEEEHGRGEEERKQEGGSGSRIEVKPVKEGKQEPKSKN